VLQLLARYRGIIVVSALLVMPLVLLYAQTKKPGARGPVVGVFIDVAGIIERGLLGSVGFVVDGIEHYVTSVAAYPELAAARRDQFTAAALQVRVDELEVQNEELRALAKAVEAIDGPRPIAARVVARKGAPLTEIITLDVGSADGVRRGDGVVDRYGVVGLVLSLGRSACDVLLLSDPSSAIDVVVQRTRARGILRGEGSDERYGARVEDFDKLRNVRPGDAIVTSGLGARFPPGVFVGTVTDAQAPENSLYLRAIVRPAAAFDRAEHVSVLIHRPTPKAPRLGREIDAEPPAAMASNPETAPTTAGAPPPAADARSIAPSANDSTDAAVAAPPDANDEGADAEPVDGGAPPLANVDAGVP
jgi:rod shape-determining protein MreC